MLFNTEKLQGMPKKIKALARREAEVSLVQQVFSPYCQHASDPRPCAVPVGLWATMLTVSVLACDKRHKLAEVGCYNYRMGTAGCVILFKAGLSYLPVLSSMFSTGWAA